MCLIGVAEVNFALSPLSRLITRKGQVRPLRSPAVVSSSIAYKSIDRVVGPSRISCNQDPQNFVEFYAAKQFSVTDLSQPLLVHHRYVRSLCDLVCLLSLSERRKANRVRIASLCPSPSLWPPPARVWLLPYYFPFRSNKTAKYLKAEDRWRRSHCTAARTREPDPHPVRGGPLR